MPAAVAGRPQPVLARLGAGRWVGHRHLVPKLRRCQAARRPSTPAPAIAMWLIPPSTQLRAGWMGM